MHVKDRSHLPVEKYPLYETEKKMDDMKRGIDRHVSTLVYMYRDSPNCIWSLVKRHINNRSRDITDSITYWCNDRCAKVRWYKSKYGIQG